MSSGTLPSSKESGEAVEASVVQPVQELAYVADRTAEWHDAEVVALFEPPHPEVTFYAINLLAVGVPVEIKAAQLRYASGQRGGSTSANASTNDYKVNPRGTSSNELNGYLERPWLSFGNGYWVP